MGIRHSALCIALIILEKKRKEIIVGNLFCISKAIANCLVSQSGVQLVIGGGRVW